MNNNLLEEMLEFFEKKVEKLKQSFRNDAKNKLSNITFKNENLESLRKCIVNGALNTPQIEDKAKSLIEAYYLGEVGNMTKLLEEIEKLGAKELFLCQKN